jgi:hypothetical protein
MVYNFTVETGDWFRNGVKKLDLFDVLDLEKQFSKKQCGSNKV